MVEQVQLSLQNISQECTYIILSYLQTKYIKNVDKRCRDIVRDRSARILQKAYKKWLYEMKQIRGNARVYLKKFLPIMFRDEIKAGMKDIIISESMSNMMMRFDEMTYNETMVYRKLRITCEKMIDRCNSYTDFEREITFKIPELLNFTNQYNIRDTIIYSVIGDIKCECILSGKLVLDLFQLVDMVKNDDVLDFYMEMISEE